MAQDHPIEARISRLLDQLENPELTDAQISQLKDKIEFLQKQKQT